MIRPGQRLYLVGDSLSVGMDKHFRSLASQAGVTYSSSTKSGTRTPQWTTATFQSALSSFSPNLVLISLGTNDSLSSLSPAQHTDAIRKLLALVRAAGAEALWILPPRLPWKETFSDLVRAEGAPVFESGEIEIPKAPDGIHSTGAGYAGWAGLVWKSITCGDKEAQPLSGPPPAFRPMIPRSKLVHRKVPVTNVGVFAKSKR